MAQSSVLFCICAVLRCFCAVLRCKLSWVARSALGQTSVNWYGSYYWNRINSEIRMLNDIKLFKKELKLSILNSYTQFFCVVILLCFYSLSIKLPQTSHQAETQMILYICIQPAFLSLLLSPLGCQLDMVIFFMGMTFWQSARN